jgi:RNA polymerase sigma factor (sigma-70 family)
MEVSALKYHGGLGLHARSPLLRLQSDERLIALIRRGNVGAFETLVSRYETRLLAFCRHLLGSREDAEDVLQEVLAAAFNAILADERPIKVRPWLYRIARNRSLNHLRRRQAIGVESMDVHYSDNGASTADKVHEREEFRLLLGDIQDLPETQRTALVLREMDALSYEQIAETMETTVPSVKSLLVRARVSLAEAAEARLLSCDQVRLELGEVAEGLKRRPSPLVRRHLRSCDRCSTFRVQLRETNKALAALLPIGPLVLFKQLAFIHLGHSAGSSAAGSAASSGATAGSAAVGSGAAAGSGIAAGSGATAMAGSAAVASSTAAAGSTTVASVAGSAVAASSGAGVVSAGIGAVATKAVAGLAAAALVTAGAVEVGGTGRGRLKHAQAAPSTGIAPAAALPLDRSGGNLHRQQKEKHAAGATKPANASATATSAAASTAKASDKAQPVVAARPAQTVVTNDPTNCVKTTATATGGTSPTGSTPATTSSASCSLPAITSTTTSACTASVTDGSGTTAPTSPSTAPSASGSTNTTDSTGSWGTTTTPGTTTTTTTPASGSASTQIPSTTATTPTTGTQPIAGCSSSGAAPATAP